jgi:hypothetical protein
MLMTKIKKILAVIFCIFFVQNMPALANSSLPIQIEVKVLGRDVIFVFYHDKDHIIDLSAKGKSVVARINIPVDYKITNPGEFKKYASGLKSLGDNQTITFKVIDDLDFQSVINGEKLDAIKFRSGEKKEEDLSTIGAANNDPGAVRYSAKGDDHTLSFNLGHKDSRIATFFRGKYLWVVFDDKKIFTFKDEGIFSKFTVVPSEAGTVLKMKVDDRYRHIRTNKTDSGWNLIVSSADNKNWEKSNILKAESLPEEEGYLIKGKFGDTTSIEFVDNEVGDTLSVIPVVTSGQRIASGVEAIEFKILSSGQGVVFALESDDVTIQKNTDSVKIVSSISLPEDASIDSNMFPAPIDHYVSLPTMLPVLNDKLKILDFNNQKSLLISEAAMSRDRNEMLERNLALARFFFIHEWYQESLDALTLAKTVAPDEYAANLQARFLEAVDLTLVGDHENAKREYDALLSYHNVKPIEEVNLWSKYNAFSMGTNPGSIGLQQNLAKSVNLYSDDKYWALAFAEIELSLLANDLKTTEKLFKELRNPPEGKYANSLKFYRASYYRKKNQLNLAKQFLTDLIVKGDDPFNSVRAEFELVKLKIEHHEMELPEAIDTLNHLRFSWRGDQLEYEMLMQLAGYYRDNNDVMNSLRTFQYIQTAFSNKVSNFYITSEMARIFNEIFLPGGLGEEMDDFTLVALFYEFKELNPIGDQGDDVIIEIAKRLVKLDLLENAADLLRHQVKYRLHGEKRIKNSDNLAIVLMMDKKPTESIMILDDSDGDNFNFNEHQYRVRLKAKALIDLRRYDDALEYLKDDNSEDASVIKREALFQSKKWANYADLVMADFDNLISKVGTDEAASQDILRLAISYYMLGVHDQLGALSGAVGDKNKVLKDTIDLLITSSEPVDYKRLDASLNINQMQLLLDKYKQQLLSK